MPTAKAALQLYRFFIGDPDVSPAEQALAKNRMPHWEQLAKNKSERIGKEWLPPAEAEAIRKRVEDKIKMASEYLRLRNGRWRSKPCSTPVSSIPTTCRPTFSSALCMA